MWQAHSILFPFLKVSLVPIMQSYLTCASMLLNGLRRWVDIISLLKYFLGAFPTVVYTYVRMFVVLCMQCVRVHVRRPMHAYVYLCAHKYVFVGLWMKCVCVYVHRPMHAYVYLCTHEYIFVGVCMQYAYVYVRRSMHTYVYLWTHEYIVTCRVVHATNKTASSSDDWIY
jgi:hypothetical protein